VLNTLYCVLSQNKEHIILELSNKSHPIFQAHFPKYPLLPGFAMIDIIAEVLGDDVIFIQYSKFIKNIFPCDTLMCKIQNDDKTRRIKIFRDKEKVSEIIYDAK